MGGAPFLFSDAECSIMVLQNVDFPQPAGPITSCPYFIFCDCKFFLLTPRDKLYAMMSSPDILNSILSLLHGALDAKKEAQNALQSNAFDPSEFISALLDLSLNTQLAEAVRQLAALTLRNYVEWHWSAKGDKFIGPQELSIEVLLKCNFRSRI